ncbi:MAG TPA: hypothetical protein VIQ80_02355 [Candidatus Saccharimonadales bacterium]
MKRARTLIIIAIIIMVIVVASSIAAIWWSNYQTAQKNQSSNNGTNSGQSNTQFQQLPAEKTADNADKIAYEGNVQGGVQELDNAIKNTTDKSQLFIYYSRKATLLLNNNQLSDALDAAKQAYQINQTSESASLVGQIAEKMNDKATAITYYQNALDHIDQTDPYAKSDADYFNGKLATLKGGR